MEADMTIRIVVLTVFTALFAAAWSSDGESTNDVVRSSRKSIEQSPETNEPKSFEREPQKTFASNGPILRVPENVVSYEATSTIVFEPVFRTISQSEWVTPETNASTEQPPTPPGIASGHYFVVTNDGLKTQLTVPGSNTNSVRDLYIYRTAERRWYYIRQESVGAVPQPKPETSGPSVATKMDEEMLVELADQEAKRRLQVVTRWLLGENETKEELIPKAQTAEAPAQAERQ